MARLRLVLLGSFQVTLDGEPVSGFMSDKVRALLAYLAVEANRPHRREALAALLWPNWPGSAALHNLRDALSNLRKTINDRTAVPPLLLVTRDTIQFNPASDHFVDATAVLKLLTTEKQAQPTVECWEQATSLYQCSFLEGFSIGDGESFDEWAAFKRQEIERLVLSALQGLADYYEQHGDYRKAEVHTRRILQVEPWREEAHRQLMRLLALSGRRSTALTQYETCRKVLDAELGVQPERETVLLYESLRDGKLSRRNALLFPPSPSLAPPASGKALAERATLNFVARERELAQLDDHLAATLAGRGRVIFVIGDAGSGKTVLIEEFCRRAMASHSNVIVASGSCNAQTGVGDPYLPFREILHMLTGDVEARRATGEIGREHSQRLRSLLPCATHALREAGPDLVDLFALGPALAPTQQTTPDGRPRPATLRSSPASPRSKSRLVNLEQVDVHQQVAGVLLALARYAPLVLVLDDLQWADRGSISLLFHIGKRLANSRILIVGAYRPGDVALGWDGERHPLEVVVNELRRHFGEVEVDLTKSEGRHFVDALLAAQPNHLQSEFHDRLYHHTGGHALFSVELLRGLQERGDLVRDEQGRWVEGPSLDWDRLPARVEAVIAERIGRLPAALRATLKVASVEGEEFTAEVVARVQDVEEPQVYRHLSGPLSREHGLVVARSVERPGGQRLSRYRFRHFLFQKYLYSQLDEVERAHRHEAVGTALETLYGAAAAQMAPQLAHQFEAAGLADRALDYLLQAGKRAASLSAHEEAVTHFARGLALLHRLPNTPEKAEREFALQLGLQGSLLANQGWGPPERERACRSAYELCQKVGRGGDFVRMLFLLADLGMAQGEHHKALELGERMLGLAKRSGEKRDLTLSHLVLGQSLFYLGHNARSTDHFEQALVPHDCQQPRSLVALVGPFVSAVCLTWSAWALLALGYPDRSLKRAHQALGLAREMDHPLSLAFALAAAGTDLRLLRREYQVAEEGVDELVQLTARPDLAMMRPWATLFQGWSRIERGEVEAGVAQMRQAISAWRSSGAVTGCVFQLAVLAQTCERHGRVQAGLDALSEAFALMERIDERGLEAELYRLRGDLLLARGEAGAAGEAETCFRQAIDVARRQEAKSWELRAALSMARVWRTLGKSAEAGQVLSEVYGWFTEGFDTPDLRDARALLEQIRLDQTSRLAPFNRLPSTESG